MNGQTLDRADARRIETFLDDLAEIGPDPNGGWSRLAFTDDERAAHEVFASAASGLGLTVTADAIGNTYAELPGEDPSAPAVVVGSHLDTVPEGGKFDGAAGVAAGLEIARILGDQARSWPFRVVAFVAEEGARFGVPCIGSRLVTGGLSPHELTELVDRDGRSVTQCATELGLNPRSTELVWPDGWVGAFLELHIEQGRVLEDRDRPLGIVHTIGGSTRLELTFLGSADHSGATPMRLRTDALAGASEFVVEVERRAAAYPTTVATVGRLEVMPGSLTTIPGRVVLAVDVRDIDSERQRELAETLLDEAARTCGRRGLKLSAELLSDQSPVALHHGLQDRLAVAAKRLGIPFAVLPSGATHDAAHVAKVAPAGMLFVPCRRGVSHAPEEWCDVEHVALGVDAAASAIASLDELDL